MSSSGSYRRIVPLCRRCGSEADSVAVFPPDGEVFVGCHPCVNTSLGDVGREYPLETYYTPDNRECVEFVPSTGKEFDLYDPDDKNYAWISASNERARDSSVSLEEWR